MPYDIAPRTKACLEAKGWSQSLLATKAGMSQPFLSKLLQGGRPQVSADTVRRLAKALHCTTDFLLGMDELEAP